MIFGHLKWNQSWGSHLFLEQIYPTYLKISSGPKQGWKNTKVVPEHIRELVLVRIQEQTKNKKTFWAPRTRTEQESNKYACSFIPGLKSINGFLTGLYKFDGLDEYKFPIYKHTRIWLHSFGIHESWRTVHPVRFSRFLFHFFLNVWNLNPEVVFDSQYKLWNIYSTFVWMGCWWKWSSFDSSL